MYGTPLRTHGVSSLVSNVGMFLLDGAVWFRYSSLKECATDVLSAGAARPAGYLSGDLLCIGRATINNQQRATRSTYATQRTLGNNGQSVYLPIGVTSHGHRWQHGCAALLWGPLLELR